ncbi:MAG: hypothetical protein IPL55_07390 [Saprospiraceae bacterium]|nr:hypothetical protein [Saprospiraceae bacterium]
MTIKERLEKWKINLDQNNYTNTYHLVNTVEGVEISLIVSFRNGLLNFSRTLDIPNDFPEPVIYLDEQLKTFDLEYWAFLRIYFEENWQSASKVDPEHNEKIEIVLSQGISTSNPTKFYSKLIISSGTYNGNDYKIDNDRIAQIYGEDDYVKINYWKHL